jgi:hypothetical protein
VPFVDELLGCLVAARLVDWLLACWLAVDVFISQILDLGISGGSLGWPWALFRWRWAHKTAPQNAFRRVELSLIRCNNLYPEGAIWVSHSGMVAVKFVEFWTAISKREVGPSASFCDGLWPIK